MWVRGCVWFGLLFNYIFERCDSGNGSFGRLVCIDGIVGVENENV